MKKDLSIIIKNIKFIIFRAMAPIYYRDANVAILVNNNKKILNNNRFMM